MTVPEIHLTARQRVAVTLLLSDTSNVERLGACVLRAEGADVVLLFGDEVLVVDENGRLQ